MKTLFPLTPLLILFVALPRGEMIADPFPIPFPENLDSYWGDPDQEPEQQSRFRDSHPMTPFTISWPINEGNPFTDWGHFRLSRNMLNGRPSEALRASTEDIPGRSELAAKYENKAWEGNSKLRISVLPPLEDVNQPSGGWPVFFVFPGSGGVGSEGIRTNRLRGPLLFATEYYRRNMPAYVVTFHPARRPFSYTGGGEMGVSMSSVWEGYLEVVDAFAEKEDVNPDRLYAIGHSMGGTSVWYLMRDRPGLLAAAVPNAGQPLSDPEAFEKTREVPILMIQGHDDTWVGSSSYLWAYEQLMNMEHPRVRFWEIQNIGHSGSSMGLTIIHQWMYQQQRGTEDLPPPPFQESRARDWTDTDGRSISAVYHQMSVEGVELILSDDRAVTIPLERLGEEERLFVFEQSGYRQWESDEGVVIIARLVDLKTDAALIEILDGNQFAIPRERFSQADQKFLKTQEKD